MGRNGLRGTGAVGMAGGCEHSLVTTRDGRVLGFGSNESGQLGLGVGLDGKVLTPLAIGVRVINK